MELRSTGLNFNETLLAKRDFHNPNITDLMKKRTGLDEHGTNYADGRMAALDVLMADFDYEKVSGEQRSTWERLQPPAGTTASLGNGVNRTAVDFVPSKVQSNYAAAMNQRRHR